MRKSTSLGNSEKSSQMLQYIQKKLLAVLWSCVISPGCGFLADHQGTVVLSSTSLIDEPRNLMGNELLIRGTLPLGEKDGVTIGNTAIGTFVDSALELYSDEILWTPDELQHKAQILRDAFARLVLVKAQIRDQLESLGSTLLKGLMDRFESRYFESNLRRDPKFQKTAKK